MSVPTTELQAWLSSQFPEGVPSWEITDDTLAILSSLYRRHCSREEDARLELEQLELARQEYGGERERLTEMLRGAGPGVVDSLNQGPAQSYADNISSACSSLNLETSLGLGSHAKLADLLARRADNIPALGKVKTELEDLRSKQLGLHEALSRAGDLLESASKEEKERQEKAVKRNTKGGFMSKKCHEYRRSKKKMEAVLAKNGGNDPRVKHTEIERLRGEVERLEEEQKPLARQCSAFSALPPSLELARARLAAAQDQLEQLENNLSGALTDLHL